MLEHRVHQFTKVEMFVCSEPCQSEKVFQDLQDIQEELFSSLGLHFQIMDMPPTDLGSSAYRYSNHIFQLCRVCMFLIYANTMLFLFFSF